MRQIQQLESLGVKGRTYVSFEGINAQLAVPYDAFDKLLRRIESAPFNTLFDVKSLTLNVEPVLLLPQVTSLLLLLVHYCCQPWRITSFGSVILLFCFP